MGGGSDLTLAAPFPDDPLDPEMNSKNVVFIVRVIILGLDGAPALCFFDFFHTASCETPTFGPRIQGFQDSGVQNPGTSRSWDPKTLGSKTHDRRETGLRRLKMKNRF